MASDDATTNEPLTVGAVGDVATSSLLWRYGGQLHLCVAVRARYALVDDGTAERVSVFNAAALSPADDRVPYRQGCDVWMIGHCNATPLTPNAPLTTRIALRGGHEQLLDKQHRLMKGSDLGVAGYGPRRTSKWLTELTDSGVVEIPRTFDWTKLHAAPPSQRVGALSGGEWLTIEGVLAARSKMRCRIPSARGEARVWSRGSQMGEPGYPIHLVADTLGIDSDSASVTVVWRGSFPIDDASVPAHVMIGAGVTDGDELDWDQGWVMAKAGVTPVGSGTLEMLATQEQAAEDPFPFHPGRPSQPEGAALRPADIEGAPWSERSPQVAPPEEADGRRKRTMTLDMTDGVDWTTAETRAALPFQPAGDTAPVLESDPQSDGPWDRISNMDTIDTAPKTQDDPALPFESSSQWPAQPETPGDDSTD